MAAAERMSRIFWKSIGIRELIYDETLVEKVFQYFIDFRFDINGKTGKVSCSACLLILTLRFDEDVE